MPQVGKQARIAGLRDLKIAELTDSAAAHSYGTAISLGANSELSFSPQIRTWQLETSLGIEDRFQKLISGQVSITKGQVDLDALVLLLGGAITQDATANASKEILKLASTDSGKAFGIVGRPLYVGGGPGDVHLMLAKCNLDSIGGFAFNGQGFTNLQIQATAFFRIHDGRLFSLATLEVLTASTFLLID